MASTATKLSLSSKETKALGLDDEDLGDDYFGDEPDHVVELRHQAEREELEAVEGLRRVADVRRKTAEIRDKERAQEVLRRPPKHEPPGHAELEVRNPSSLLTWGQPEKYRLGSTEHREYLRGVPTAIKRELHENSYQVPLALSKLPPAAVRQVACGAAFTMMLNVKGQVWMWGGSQASPVQVSQLQNFVLQIACGSRHMCAITDESAVNLYTWGQNEYGQLGHGNTTSLVIPRKVTGLRERSVHIACGGDFTFSVTDSGRVYGWGNNNTGQLGLGDSKVELDESTRRPITKWIPSAELVVLSPALVRHLSHSAYIEEQLTNSETLACGQEHATAWAKTQKAAVLTPGAAFTQEQIATITALREENARMKNELAEKDTVIERYETQIRQLGGKVVGGRGDASVPSISGAASGAPAAAHATGGKGVPPTAATTPQPLPVHSEHEEEAPDRTVEDDSFLRVISKLIDNVRAERNLLSERIVTEKARMLQLNAAKALVDQRANIGTENQKRLWNKLHLLSNRVSLIEDGLMKLRNPKEIEVKQRELAALRLERDDVMEVVMANERLHESTVEEQHARITEAGVEQLELQRLQEKHSELDSMYDVIIQLKRDRMENLKRKHSKAFHAELTDLIAKVSGIHVSIRRLAPELLAANPGTVQGLTKRLRRLPTLTDFIHFSNEQLGKVVVLADQQLRSFEREDVLLLPGRQLYTIVNTNVGMQREKNTMLAAVMRQTESRVARLSEDMFAHVLLKGLHGPLGRPEKIEVQLPGGSDDDDDDDDGDRT